MKRHAYRKDPDSEGMCTCGEGRSQEVHRVLSWRKARTGNWLSDNGRGAVYRCREAGGQWIPEYGQNPLWVSIGDPMTLAKAKAVCEEHRGSNGN